MRMGTQLVIVLVTALALVACVGELSGDSSDFCQVAITFTPDPAVVSDEPVVATAEVINAGNAALSYDWTITFGATTTTKSGRQISFPAPEAGVYHVHLAEPARGCRAVDAALNVGQPGATTEVYHVRVTVPGNTSYTVPYYEDRNADTERDLVLPTARPVSGVVRRGDVGVPALLRFFLASATDAFAELATDAQGRFVYPLQAKAHDVLVVPTTQLAPQRVLGWTPSGAQAVIELSADQVISGQVLGPSATGLGDARVALHIDGVPTTVGLTGADGRFTVRGRSGTRIDFAVTPPPASGLPRLVGSTSSVAVGSLPAIRYAGGLSQRNLAGLRLTKAGAPAGGARVWVVGTIAAAAELVGANVDLDGHVRATALADGSGVIDSMNVPQAALFAVIQAATGELATRALDTTVAPPAALDIGPQPLVTGTATLAGAPLPGAQIQLEPQGPLADAGAPVVIATAAANGAFSIAAGQGGTYRVVLADPQRRALPTSVVANVPAALGPRELRPRFVRSGAVRTEDGVVPDAVIELLCPSCTGLDRQRPLSQSMSNGEGRFFLAVPKRAFDARDL